jgi:AraC-like DNA-binding protein/mannose-6-phosphate isomerase-like protein (cupin superfamily)
MMRRNQPRALRSVDPRDYQAVPRPIAAMAKSFVAGFEIAAHDHPRDQLLYAVTGVMRVRTRQGVWIVPPDRAVYVPGGTIHSVTIRSDLEMRTLYIDPRGCPGLPVTPAVIEVSDLLRALVLAMIDEPLLYEEDGRGGAIAQVILSEITRATIDRAKPMSLVLPMPRDARLQRVCRAILDEPASRLTLEGWAEAGGASVRTLARLFQREVGLSFAMWRQRVRFHNALEAIVRGESISRVAASNGYSSTSAFTAAFRRVMGQPPTALRPPR